MGSLFRSEEMTLCQLFLHTDSAYACISELGELGAVQFVDTIPDTNAFQRKFVNEVRRCEEMERKLHFLEKEIVLDSIPILNTAENFPAPEPREIIDLETNLESLEDDLKEVNNNYEQLNKNFHELVELNYLLQKTKAFFEDGVDTQIIQDYEYATDDKENILSNQSNVRFIAGVILREKMIGFERMVWRVCRGNVLIKFSDIDVDLEDLNTPNKKVSKSVFAVFFQGEQLRLRVRKVCEAYHATIYPCTDNPVERADMIKGVMTRMDELKRVLEQTESHRHSVLVTAARQLRMWFIKVRKIKSIYHALNLFNIAVTDKCMIGECWCPVNDLDAIHVALRKGMERSNGTVQPILNRLGDGFKKNKPPTYHRTNKFTEAFQSIVDAYGVACYREVNPAPFTVITFPFLFAVMFGDAGHGLLMFLFALILVIKEEHFLRQKSTNEVWNIFFGGRYIILLMGLFSIYTGLIYNDIFSKSFNIFGSSWYPNEYNQSTIDSNTELQINPNLTKNFKGFPYPFGIDPIWQFASNKITFTNSVKMKMSIILGVFQMLFGVSLSLFNQVFFKDYLSIFTEFIPQIIFLLAIFGYLVVEIFVKWIIYNANTSGDAPSLLIGLINMFMFSNDPKDFFYGQAQFYVQSTLVIVAFLCIPWMLLVKPFVLLSRHKRSHRHLVKEDKQILIDSEHDNDGADVNQSLHSIPHEVADSSVGKTDLTESSELSVEEEFEFGEVFVHQCIHTIEYCLGCISNTASYLRLWALSLAHAQLSEVLWNMVFHIALSMDNYGGLVVVFFIFAVWAVLTIGILLLMEGLSAFLHALRLHWVEFQNKFYKGEGHSFIPFTFKGVDDLSAE